jgi:hypothetical protein
LSPKLSPARPGQTRISQDNSSPGDSKKPDFSGFAGGVRSAQGGAMHFQ